MEQNAMDFLRKEVLKRRLWRGGPDIILDHIGGSRSFIEALAAMGISNRYLFVESESPEWVITTLRTAPEPVQEVTDVVFD